MSMSMVAKGKIRYSALKGEEIQKVGIKFKWKSNNGSNEVLKNGTLVPIEVKGSGLS